MLQGQRSAACGQWKEHFGVVAAGILITIGWWLQNAGKRQLTPTIGRLR